MDLAPSAPLAAHLLVQGFAARILVAAGPERATAALDDAEIFLAGSSGCQPRSIGYQVTEHGCHQGPKWRRHPI
jgi:hypothetical protein